MSLLVVGILFALAWSCFNIAFTRFYLSEIRRENRRSEELIRVLNRLHEEDGR